MGRICDGCANHKGRKRAGGICDEGKVRWRDHAICDKRSKGQCLAIWMKGGAELGEKGARPYMTLKSGFLAFFNVFPA